MNPAIAAALVQGGFGMMEGFGDFLGGGTQRDMQKQQLMAQRWKLSKAKEMYAQLQAMMKAGTTMGGGKKAQMMAQNRQRLAPALGKIRSFAGQAGSMSSPELHRMIMQNYMPMEAGYSQKLDEMDLGNLQGLRKGLLGMVYG